MSAPSTPVRASVAAQTMPTRSHLRLAEAAVAESVADAMRSPKAPALDWFGLACSITDARVRDLNEGAA